MEASPKRARVEAGAKCGLMERMKEKAKVQWKEEEEDLEAEKEEHLKAEREQRLKAEEDERELEETCQAAASMVKTWAVDVDKATDALNMAIDKLGAEVERAQNNMYLHTKEVDKFKFKTDELERMLRSVRKELAEKAALYSSRDDEKEEDSSESEGED
jgi:hypothetical protein